MRAQDAIDRLGLIHDQLARAEVYPGFRPPAVALVGALGLLAAAAQPLAPVGFVAYWLGVAGVGGVIGFAAAARSYAHEEDDLERRRTRRVMAQFLPCLLAGGAVTVGVARADAVQLLPGLWALLFGLGVVAARPHLPAAVWFVGAGYVAVGAALMATADAEPSGWAVGGVFGVGHLATAVALRGRREECHE
ncbi:hypothetical protein [Urbifossiella limnaea]|uniref:Uncharacterized protein n=1 Tax=Urbifossiella limnaea TaxID=2528023 RepID=A0A517XLR7_9BACT|nr:hypothetical protein [Urbifossiella limnaea]QDU18444.1 hypothetical protein ETAA1_03320 [Urbifossiella limnaea]